MTNVRFLGMICAFFGILSIYFNLYTDLIQWGLFSLGILFYAVIGYQEQYQGKEIRIGQY